MKTERLYYCKANIVHQNNKIILVSYHTPVVIIDKKNDFIAIYRYNSVTTAQHLRKFQKWLYNNVEFKKYQQYRDLLDLAVKKYKKCFAFLDIAGYHFFDYSIRVHNDFERLLSY